MFTVLNVFPSKNGISSDLKPAAIILGSPNIDYYKLSITFSSYAQVCIGTTNNTKKIPVETIVQLPENERLEHYFMSLANGN